jgi:hypothetical protein
MPLRVFSAGFGGITVCHGDGTFGRIQHRQTGVTMKAVKGIYEQGKIELAENPVEQGPVEVLVVFPELADDPWREILSDPTPRPALAQWVREVQAEVAQGQATPLDLQQF